MDLGGELLPGGVVVQGVLQQARRLVLDVVHPRRAAMPLAEPLDAAVQVAPLVADDRSRNAGLGAGGLQNRSMPLCRSLPWSLMIARGTPVLALAAFN